jgi:hypothetical protein
VHLRVAGSLLARLGGTAAEENGGRVADHGEDDGDTKADRGADDFAVAGVLVGAALKTDDGEGDAFHG